MKKVFAILTVLTFCLGTSYAQESKMSERAVSKGNFFIGGTAGFNTSSSDVDASGQTEIQNVDGGSSTTINFSPSIGYFLTNRFGLGFTVDYSLQTQELGGDESTDSDLLIGPMARYYLPFTNSAAGFLQLKTGFGTTDNNIIIDDQIVNATNSIVKVGIGPGITIFSSNAIGIEAIAMYNFINSNADAELNGSDISVTSTTNEFDFQIGLQIYLSRLKPVR